MVNLRVYWNGGGIWFHPRKPNVTDVAYQLDNWYHFLWLCGDHIDEQHIHNLDVANWVMGGPPEKADGAGGRTPGNPSRPSGPPDVVGNIYDNFSIDFTYPNGVHMYSSCRHLPDCAPNDCTMNEWMTSAAVTWTRMVLPTGTAVSTWLLWGGWVAIRDNRWSGLEIAQIVLSPCSASRIFSIVCTIR